ncbi:MAG: type 1 glutamine amidotransferase [Ktedonobacteraceae bacterium]
MKQVLAIQNYWDDTPGYLGEILQEHDIACEIIKAEETPLPDPGRYNAIFALGGPQHANDPYPYLEQEKALLRQVVEQDIPYLGICLGAQLLASAMGAPVTRHHTTEIGFFEVQLTDEGKSDPLFAGLPGYQQVIHWHEDTFAIPPGALHLVTSPDTPNQAFRIGKRAYGLQYHIEVTPQMLDTWFGHPDYKKEIMRVSSPDVLTAIAQDIPKRYPLYRKHTRILFENFLKITGCL